MKKMALVAALAVSFSGAAFAAETTTAAGANQDCSQNTFSGCTKYTDKGIGGSVDFERRFKGDAAIYGGFEYPPR